MTLVTVSFKLPKSINNTCLAAAGDVKSQQFATINRAEAHQEQGITVAETKTDRRQSLLRRLTVRTRAKVEFQDITGLVQEEVEASGARSGQCIVFVPHTTAGITLNEHDDPGVAEDITARLANLVPEHISYQHTEGNATAHVKASLIGNSLTLIVDNSQLILGTWQGVFFCEFDGPRTRSVVVKVIPDKD